MKESGHLFIHKSKITNLESYAGLDIFVSIDESGLVNVFSFVPELSIRATFKISYLKAA
jgi:hypothetical protein